MKKKGYTLIELVTALAIFALLVGLGIPLYEDHMNKATVAAALSTLTNLAQAGVIAYEENPSTTTLTYGGVTFNNNVITALSIPPVYYASFLPGGTGNGNVPAGQFLVCVYVSNLNFTGYVAPAPGNAGTYSRMCKQVASKQWGAAATDTRWSAKCGSLQNNTSDIPYKYMPIGCRCMGIWLNIWGCFNAL